MSPTSPQADRIVRARSACASRWRARGARALLPTLIFGAAAATLPTQIAAQEVRAASASDPEADAILLDASARYATLQGFCGEFVQSIDVTLLGETKDSRGELCWLRPDRFEMRFTDPEGDRIVADGIDLWVYFPSTDDGQAFRTRLAETGGRYDLHREFLAEPGERYDAELEGTDMIDGTEMNVLDLTPRVPSPYRRARIWIDPESDLIRKLEILEESESIRTVELSGMRLDPDLSRARFRFDPPPDVQVIRR